MGGMGSENDNIAGSTLEGLTQLPESLKDTTSLIWLKQMLS